MHGYIFIFFSTILTKGNKFCDFLFASLDKTLKSSKMGSTLKGNNFFLREQILFYMSRVTLTGEAKMNMTGVAPPVYPLTLNQEALLE